MIYILFFSLILTSRTVTTSIEFNTKEACQAAAKEIMSQAQRKPDIILCAAKGNLPNIRK